MALSGIQGLEKLSQLDSRIRPIVQSIFQLLAQFGVKGQLYDVYRSPQQQEVRFAAGDTKAHAGESPHQFGLAFDFVVEQGEKSAFQKMLQSWWHSIGFTTIDWDPAHVEVPEWRGWVKK